MEQLKFFFLFIITLLLYYPLTFLFSFSIFILVICSSSFVQALHFYSLPGNNMYVPSDCNILLIYVCDL